MDSLALLIAASLSAGTTLALAGLGLMINERAGVVNLGAEGLLLMAAMVSFVTAVHTDNDWLAFSAGAGTGGLLALCFGVLVIWGNTHQFASGLALSLLATGVSAFIGSPYTQAQLSDRAQYALPLLAELPFLGSALFRQHPLVYGTIALAWGLWYFFAHSRSGLLLRAIGEAPEAAHALGYPVRALRLLAVLAGGALCGLAGAYLSVVYTPLWAEGMVAGKGWIALALTTFATWRAWRVLLGAYLFGGVTMLQFHLQAQGVAIASQWLSMLPYVATIMVLVSSSRNPAWTRANIPASLGKIFSPPGA